jgi:hypothetical protein
MHQYMIWQYNKYLPLWNEQVYTGDKETQNVAGYSSIPFPFDNIKCGMNGSVQYSMMHDVLKLLLSALFHPKSQGSMNAIGFCDRIF